MCGWLMMQSKILIFITIILAITLIGCTKTITDCEMLPYQQMKDQCYLQAVSSLNVKEITDYCKNIDDEKVSSQCWSILGAKLQDTSYCKKSSDVNFKELCIANIGVSTNDVNLCKELSIENISVVCFTGIAKLSQILNDCDVMKNQAFKDYCYAEVIGTRVDNVDCKIFSTQDGRDMCYSRIAIAKKDKSSCQNIQSFDIKDDCFNKLKSCDDIQNVNKRDVCYNALWQEVNDPAICEKIQTVQFKDNCYRSVSVVARNVNGCSKITSQDVKDDCYFKIATTPDISNPQRMDFCQISTCNKISGNQRNNCYSSILLNTQFSSPGSFKSTTDDCVSSMCAEISLSDKKGLSDECYRVWYMYGDSTDKSICDNLVGSIEHPDWEISHKYECYSTIGKRTHDENLCIKSLDGIAGDAVNWGRDCFSAAAIWKNDVTICDSGSSISPDFNSNGCKIDYAIAKKDISVCDALQGNFGVSCRSGVLAAS